MYGTDTVISSYTSVNLYQARRLRIPADGTMHTETSNVVKFVLILFEQVGNTPMNPLKHNGQYMYQ